MILNFEILKHFLLACNVELVYFLDQTDMSNLTVFVVISNALKMCTNDFILMCVCMPVYVGMK